MEIRTNYFDFYKPHEWEEIIEDWKKSGLSQAAYCKSKRISVWSFYQWKAKFEPFAHISIQDIRNRWKDRIEEWHKSGLTKRAYCREKEIDPVVFSKWERRLDFSPPLPLASEKWGIIIEDWKKSGLKRHEYCRKKKIVYSSFYNWTKRPTASDLPSSLIKAEEAQPEVSLQSPSDSLEFKEAIPAEPFYPDLKMEVVLPQGHRLIFEGLFDREKITAWLEPLLKTGN